MLREISLFWSMLHTLVLFLLLFESRYPKKKAMIITCATMTPLIAINTVLTFSLDADRMGIVMLATLSLPSLIVFWMLAKHRDGRFFFTFCLVDTMVLEIIYISQILNHFITPDSYIFMFVTRLVVFPILEWLVFKKIRKEFLNIQKQAKPGWAIFAVIGALFYVLITLTASYPIVITERPEYLPAAILLFILIPVIYIHIILTLRRLQRMYQMTEQENILKLQVNNMTARMEELAAADKKFRMERHNFRHKMKTIASLVETEQYEELRNLLEDYNEAIKATQVKRYCQNAVIDAVLSTYIQKAENNGIRVNFGFAFPDTIPVNEIELATVLANALENAINACEKLDQEKRYIDIKVLNRPRFMIQIANAFDGNIEFDETDIPINHEEEHGFGTRSIVAFCEKNDAYYQFNADDEKFTLYLNF